MFNRRFSAQEIYREAVLVAAPLFVESLGGRAVEGTQIRVQKHLLCAQDRIDRAMVVDGYQCGVRAWNPCL